MSIPIPEIKKNRKEIDKAIETTKRNARKEQEYQYAFDVKKSQMQKFLGVCRVEGSSGPKELRAFIDRYLERALERLPK